MKYLSLVAAVFALNSCNTTIGIYRDTKQAFLWTKEKIQNCRSGHGSDDASGDAYGGADAGGAAGGAYDDSAPVY